MKRATNNVNFNLKVVDSTKQAHILLIFRYGNYKDEGILKYYTGLKVYPEDWNVKKQRAREGGVSYLIEINKRLVIIEQETLGIYYKNLNKNVLLLPKAFRKELDKILYPEIERKDSFFGYFDKFIEQSEKTGAKSKGTISSYVTVKNLLKKYAETLSSGNLDFEDFSMDLYEELQTWAYSKGYSPNYFGRAITVTKMILKKAYKAKLYKTSDPVFKDEDFKAPSKPVHKIHLDKKELSDIYSVDLSEIKRLDRVRDLFILSCLTGLRYSDMVNLTSDHFTLSEDPETGQEGYYLEMITEKTDEPIALPVNPTVIEILEKYSWQLPEPVSNQNFNKYLKEIGEMAGINKKERTERRKGNEETGYMRVSEMVPKWEMIETHTGRRTFVTNSDASPDLIMSMVGHRSAGMFLKYDKKSPLQKAKKAAKSPYLTTPLLRKVK